MTDTDHFEAGLATLSKDAKEDFPDAAPWKVSGVAIPVNTIVNGGQNTDHFFPPEVLEDSGKLLEGKPIVKNFHELEGQASADDVIGEVTSAGFQQGVGLVFEGEITDPDIAQKIKQGYLDVSPTPARSLGEFDDSMGAQEVTRLADFRDIAVVANGQPGAKVEMGANPAIEALARDALSRGFDPLANDVSVDDIVSWPSSGDRRAYGVVDEIRREGDEPLDSEIDGDQTITPPAALIEVHQPTQDGWEATGTMVGHKLDTVRVEDSFPDADSLQSDIDTTPPEQAQTNAQAVLDVQDKTDAMTKTGWQRANQLADGESLSEDTIQRMAQFNRHRDNTQYDNFADVPDSRKGEDADNPWWEDKGTVAWFGWGGTAGIEWAIDQAEEMDSMADSDTLTSDFKTVAGVRFQGTRDGELDESEIDKEETNLSDHYLYGDGENKEDYSYPVVDADGFLRKGNVEAAHQLGCRGQCPSSDTHDSNLMDLADEFDNPPEFAQEETDTNSATVKVVDEIEVVETDTATEVEVIEK